MNLGANDIVNAGTVIAGQNVPGARLTFADDATEWDQRATRSQEDVSIASACGTRSEPASLVGHPDRLGPVARPDLGHRG